MTLCTLGVCAQTNPYYEFPDGAFAAGIGPNTAWYVPNVYMPYSPEKRFWTSIVGEGTWFENNVEKEAGTVSYGIVSSLGYFDYIPQLKIADKMYMYGAGYTGTSANGRFYNGTAEFKYLTPARLFDLNDTQASANQYSLINSFKTNNSDKIGEFFNNTDVMYIKEIVLPVTANKSGAKITDLLPNDDCKFDLTIYHATITKEDGANINSADYDHPIFKKTITKDDLGDLSSVGAGTFSFKFDSPISIYGAFLIEVTGMKTSGCTFFFRSDKSAKNNTSYYYNGTKNAYPTVAGSYAPNLLFSVNAMFPALYKDDASVEELVLPGKGGDVSAVIHSNVDPKAGEGFSIVVPDWLNYEVSYEDTKFSLSKKNTITFTAEANEGEEREGDITITNRGKVITYHIIQSAKGEDIIPLESVTLNTTSYILKKGYKYTLVATLTPSNATDNEITWTSSNESVVTVDNVDGTDPAGTIHYKGDGIATITATVGDKTATCVVKAVSGVKLNITSAKWATLGLDYPVNIPSGVVAYKASVDGTTVSLTEITGGKIPANEGVILYADEPGEYNFTVAGNLSPFTGNALKAAIETYNYTADENVYYLGLDGEKVVFKHLTSGSIAAGKAYLLAPKASEAKLDVVVEGTPTGITEVVPMAVKNDGIYNIQGVRVNNSFKGVVIMNGKKYLKK